MDFLKDVKKDLEKAGIDIGASEPPRYWFSTGNYVLNKIISGSFLKGIPQGRILCYTGPASSGKSFLAVNGMREAQKNGAHIVVLDSENALDDDFVGAIGVDPTHNYSYVPVDTLAQCKKVVSKFITGYKKEYGNDSHAPKILFVIDSLDMLITETELTHFEKGETKGDQGQRNKQQKAMLREFVQAVKRPNISMIVTSQVYRNQDKFTDETWVVSDAIQYSLSQVVLLDKLKLKDKDTRDITGIRMKCRGFKTRFTQPFQSVTLEVPYSTGMDPFNGLKDVALEMDIIQQKGAWFYFDNEKFRASDLEDGPRQKELCTSILTRCEASREKFLEADISFEDLDLSVGPTSKAKRKTKYDETKEGE